MAKRKQDKSEKKVKKVFKDKAEMIAAIELKYGPGSIMTSKSRVDVDVISTGSPSLDAALGVGGVPRGRIVEIYGPEGSGKTTLSLSVIKEAQQQGASAAFVDAEHALDNNWAADIGVNIDDLLISQPNSGEEALDIVAMLAESGLTDLIVIDSVAALVPQKEIDGEFGESHIGLQARLMSQAMRKLVALVKKSKCTVIFINQIRMKIGVMFGNPEVTPGGRALKFYSSVRMDIRRKQALKDGDEVVGSEVTVKVVKNKVAPPHRVATCYIYFGSSGYPFGIDYASSLIDMAVESELVLKQGAWFSYNEVRLGQGRNNSCTFLRENPDIMGEIKSKVMEAHGIHEHERSDESIDTPVGEET